MSYDVNNQLELVFADTNGNGSQDADEATVAQYAYDVLDTRRTQGVPVLRTPGAAGAASQGAGRIEFVNHYDGKVNALDKGPLYAAILGGGDPCVYPATYDLNGDGSIDALDKGPLFGQILAGAENTEAPASGLGNPYNFTARRLDTYLDAPIGTNGAKQIQHNRARYYDLDNGPKKVDRKR